MLRIVVCASTFAFFWLALATLALSLVVRFVARDLG